MLDQRPWKYKDGDTRCKNCGLRNPIWRAPHSVWNRVVGGVDARDDPGGILCPTCFLNLADVEIGAKFWELRFEEAEKKFVSITLESDDEFTVRMEDDTFRLPNKDARALAGCIFGLLAEQEAD